MEKTSSIFIFIGSKSVSIITLAASLLLVMLMSSTCFAQAADVDSAHSSSKALALTENSAQGVGLKDPTMPPGFIQSEEGDNNKVAGPLKLSAIFVRSTGNLAVINNKVLSVGDKIGSFELLTITPETATVKGLDGSVQELRLIKKIH